MVDVCEISKAAVFTGQGFFIRSAEAFAVRPGPVCASGAGISKVTLYDWRKQARAKGFVVPGDGRNSEHWSAEDKFAVVMETAWQVVLWTTNNVTLYAGLSE